MIGGRSLLVVLGRPSGSVTGITCTASSLGLALLRKTAALVRREMEENCRTMIKERMVLRALGRNSWKSTGMRAHVMLEQREAGLREASGLAAGQHILKLYLA